MGKLYYPIRIARTVGVIESREKAILKLDNFPHLLGREVLVRYWAGPDKIDTILAIGIAEGPGKNSYKIISIAGILYVSDVVTELPDVSELVHGETYVYLDETNKESWLVYLEGDTRVYSSLPENEQTVVSLKTGYSWFISKAIVKRVSDFYTQKQIDEMLLGISGDITIVVQNLEQKINDLRAETNQAITDLTQNFNDLSTKVDDAIEKIDQIGSFKEKAIAETYADLTDSSNWISPSGVDLSYPGILVTVLNDPDPKKNGLYNLRGSDWSLASTWVKTGDEVIIDSPEEPDNKKAIWIDQTASYTPTTINEDVASLIRSVYSLTNRMNSVEYAFTHEISFGDFDNNLKSDNSVSPIEPDVEQEISKETILLPDGSTSTITNLIKTKTTLSADLVTTETVTTVISESSKGDKITSAETVKVIWKSSDLVHEVKRETRLVEIEETPILPEGTYRIVERTTDTDQNGIQTVTTIEKEKRIIYDSPFEGDKTESLSILGGDTIVTITSATIVIGNTTTDKVSKTTTHPDNTSVLDIISTLKTKDYQAGILRTTTTTIEESKDADGNVTSTTTDENVSETSLYGTAEKANAKHMAIKMGTKEKLDEILLLPPTQFPFVPGEILFVYDVPVVYIVSPVGNQLVPISGSGTSGFMGASMMSLAVEEPSVEGISLVKSGLKIATQEDYMPGLVISSAYAAKTGKYLYGPVSHGFVELYNRTETEINLWGKYLRVWLDGAWQDLALTGTIAPYSTYTIRCAQTSVPNVNTTILKVEPGDQEWDISLASGRIWLTHGNREFLSNQPVAEGGWKEHGTVDFVLLRDITGEVVYFRDNALDPNLTTGDMLPEKSYVRRTSPCPFDWSVSPLTEVWTAGSGSDTITWTTSDWNPGTKYSPQSYTRVVDPSGQPWTSYTASRGTRSSSTGIVLLPTNPEGEIKKDTQRLYIWPSEKVKNGNRLSEWIDCFNKYPSGVRFLGISSGQDLHDPEIWQGPESLAKKGDSDIVASLIGPSMKDDWSRDVDGMTIIGYQTGNIESLISLLGDAKNPVLLLPRNFDDQVRAVIEAFKVPYCLIKENISGQVDYEYLWEGPIVKNKTKVLLMTGNSYRASAVSVDNILEASDLSVKEILGHMTMTFDPDFPGIDKNTTEYFWFPETKEETYEIVFGKLIKV